MGPVVFRSRMARLRSSTALLGGVLFLTLLLPHDLWSAPQVDTVAPTAQTPNNTATSMRAIVGKVLDSGGATVPGAIVLLKDMKSLQVRSYIVPSDGTYRFYGLSGDIPYEVRAQSVGLSSDIKTVSVFDSHKQIKVNLKLKEPKKKKKFFFF
jgi:hypothetical protein